MEHITAIKNDYSTFYVTQMTLFGFCHTSKHSHKIDFANESGSIICWNKQEQDGVIIQSSLPVIFLC